MHPRLERSTCSRGAIRAFVVVVSLLLQSCAANDMPAATGTSDDPRLVIAGEPVGPRDDGTGAFRTHCLETHIANDDPLVHPGKPGDAHEHVFIGNGSVDAFTTAQSLLDAKTTKCDGGTLNRSGYWVPSLYDAHGNRLRYVDPLIYYKTGYHVDPEVIQSLPEGLQIIAGDAMATAPQSVRVAKFRCASWTPTEPQFSNGDPLDHINRFPDCAVGDMVEMRLLFPQCWDGINLTSTNLQSHMAYPNAAVAPTPSTGACPASHPVALPEISYNFHVRVTAESGSPTQWRFVTDPSGAPGGTTFHGDWMNGWDTAIMDTIVKNCLNAKQECMVGLLGDGTRLRPVPLD